MLWQVGVKIVISQEEEPMGTAGPLALARQELDDGSGEPFFVLNSDVICEYPLKEMLEFHKARSAEGTLLVTKVRRRGPALSALVVPAQTSARGLWCVMQSASVSLLGGGPIQVWCGGYG